MDSVHEAVNQMEKIRNWTQRPLEVEPALAELDCHCVLLTVAAPQHRPTTAHNDAIGSYTSLTRSLHRAHEDYRSNATAGPFSQLLHCITRGGPASANRNYRGAYETALVLARLTKDLNEPHTTDEWLHKAAGMFERYDQTSTPPHHRYLGATRDPTAAWFMLNRHLQDSYETSFSLLRSLFQETRQCISAR